MSPAPGNGGRLATDCTPKLRQQQRCVLLDRLALPLFQGGVAHNGIEILERVEVEEVALTDLARIDQQIPGVGLLKCQLLELALLDIGG